MALRHVITLATASVVATLALVAQAPSKSSPKPPMAIPFTEKIGLKNAHKGAWEEIFPGGETKCAHGGDFSFFLYRGDPDKVLVDFLGGGACWDAKSCGKKSLIYSADMDVFREIASWGLKGIYNHDDRKNPYREWTHVVVPYCTGDLHWGAADKTYTDEDGKDFVIHHRGAINARAVLDWTKANLETPAKMNVHGCSAGAYGSIYWTPHLRESYPQTRLRQFGEAGAGVMPASFKKTIVPAWNVTANAPSWVPGLDPAKTDYTTLEQTDVYMRTAAYYPDVEFGQFQPAHDGIQAWFYSMMGGEITTWTRQMMASIETIGSKTPNFRSFVAPGLMHCSTIVDNYNPRCGGKTFRSWLDDYANSDELPEDVNCALLDK